ncbi:ATP-dependent helicase [Natronospora cellulosivora (SeqCode)]
MLLRIIKSFFNLFIDEEQEYIDRKIREYHDLFYKTGKYPLNPKQCEAVIKNKKYNQVIAAAGTGKTTVLAYRIKYLIEEGIDPKRILAITYSKKAAKEMEIRLKRQFSINKVEVRTIHSFAYKIIRKEYKEPQSIVTAYEMKKFIRNEINHLINNDADFQNYYFKFFRYYHNEELNNSIFEDDTELITKMTINNFTLLDNFIMFIDLAKKNNIKVEEIEKLLNKNNESQYYFGLSAKILYEKYHLYLLKNQKLDFNDMIYKSIDILKKKPEKYYKEYDHMLVDEFQDVSLAHIKFIKNFFTKGSNMNLFCVGDDWQSIYSFQGSEPKYFIKFENYFGQAAKTYLTDNYRCPATILDAGNSLISNNKNQIKKKVRANNKNDSRPVLHILEKKLNYKDFLARYTLILLKNLLKQGSKPSDIMILCRYDEAVPYLDKVKNYLRKEKIPYQGKSNDYYNPKDQSRKPKNAVSVFSIHQSKGCEADNVILVHAVAKGPHSFPEAARENELLDTVKINKVDHLEEERRLFYVAMTRTAKNLHILSQENNISPFIKEIRPYIKVKKIVSNSTETAEYIDIKAKVETLWKEHSSKIKQVGLLKTKAGKVVKFLSWENANAPLLEENRWYELRKLKVSEFNNKRQLVLTSITEVSHLTKKH